MHCLRQSLQISLGSYLAALAVFGIAYTGIWLRTLVSRGELVMPKPLEIATGLVTDFFDTLGLGCYATTTAIFQLTRMVPDELIPGTLNVGHTLPVIFEAFLFIAVIEVDTATLVLLLAAATAGAWFGAGWVSRLPKRKVQIGVGCALVIAFVALLMRQLELFPAGGTAVKLTGLSLIVAVIANGLIGALSTLGIGIYAPCMTMVSLLGMNPAAAFPIMMGSAAFLGPVAGTRFVLNNAYSPRVALGLTIGGLIGVPIAAFLVKSLPLGTLRWLVMAVVLYAAQAMLRSAYKARGVIGEKQ